MKLSVDIINILFLLLPGLVTSQVYYYFTKTEDISGVRRIYDTVIYSFMIMVITGLFIKWEPIVQATVNGKNLSSFEVSKDSGLLLINIALMIIIPTVISALVHHDIFHRLLRKFNLTTKSSRKDTWNDTFISEKRYVVIYLKDERRIRGFPERFSNDPEEGLIYLRNPAWIDDSENGQDYIELETHGMLIHRENIDMIEFTLDKDGN